MISREKYFKEKSSLLEMATAEESSKNFLKYKPNFSNLIEEKVIHLRENGEFEVDPEFLTDLSKMIDLLEKSAKI